MTITERLCRYGRAVSHLRRRQIAHRLQLRARERLRSYFGEVIPVRKRQPVKQHQWPAAFRALDEIAADPSLAPDYSASRFTFLNERRDLGLAPDWKQNDAPHLWRYHLHYMEWAWSFAVHPERTWARSAFHALWMSWLTNVPYGDDDAWSPYVTSLRTWVLCGVYDPLIRDSPIEGRFVEHLRRHALFVRRNLEWDVGGNHLVKNLKALIGAGIFLHDDRLLAVGLKHLAGQLTTQVLADGGHFELSPSYHCQVLGDLADIQSLLTQAGISTPYGLATSIHIMRQWLGHMLLPDGTLPHFNDSVSVPRPRIAGLRPIVARSGPLALLAQSGYATVRIGRLHLVLDFGQPCPVDLPAHAHADCLSFELCADGERVVVNSGTSTYEAGSRREFERSTRAHTTVQIADMEQTEVFGRFRAGRRATARLLFAELRHNNGVRLAAEHSGYSHLPGSPVHRRTWDLAGDSLVVSDLVLSTKSVSFVSRFYIVGSAMQESSNEFWLSDGRLKLRVLGGTVDADLESSQIATSFGRLEPGFVLLARGTSDRELAIEFTLRNPALKI
jgi:uncharacterized heparinase superfamily protein